jgi:hypothetical protein
MQPNGTPGYTAGQGRFGQESERGAVCPIVTQTPNSTVLAHEFGCRAGRVFEARDSTLERDGGPRRLDPPYGYGPRRNRET